MAKFRNTLLIFSFLFASITKLHAMSHGEFLKWWTEYRVQSAIPHELRQMEDYFVTSKYLTESSNYWNHLNHYNIQQITLYGYENFKQTVCRNYFTWVVSIDNPYAINLKKKVPYFIIHLPASEMNKTFSFFSPLESYKFNEITEYFLNYILHKGYGQALEKLEEPLIGNPPCLVYNNKRISQDIFNSILEYQAVAKGCNVQDLHTIIEIGAGSGRTAFCFISLLQNVKYIIVDFPPALYVSQSYLKDLFPNKKVMTFRPFDKFDEIKNEFEKSDIIFLMPDQLSKLPNKTADLFLAIDCLHEMKLNSIKSYFNEANRLASNIYFKCWIKTTMPYDGIIYTMNSYPVLQTWSKLFKEPCDIPSDFFHAFYKINK